MRGTSDRGAIRTSRENQKQQKDRKPLHGLLHHIEKTQVVRHIRLTIRQGLHSHPQPTRGHERAIPVALPLIHYHDLRNPTRTIPFTYPQKKGRMISMWPAWVVPMIKRRDDRPWDQRIARTEIHHTPTLFVKPRSTLMQKPCRRKSVRGNWLDRTSRPAPAARGSSAPAGPPRRASRTGAPARTRPRARAAPPAGPIQPA